ncbi:MAG TPA: peptidoglycan DD-metalloendopeptidase family protein [Acidimicrobiia bacterium]|nr:peptidoglycan DD-metalloendopeptidase family protein [Acidimicrobiia bacterium]
MAVALAGAGLVGVGSSAGAASAPDGPRVVAPAPGRRFTPPVPGTVLRPFSAPRARYGPGHRGVDFAAGPGDEVRAAGDGTVVFAGSVAGSLHVVVAHAGDLRTSYSYLASISVRKGARVARGVVVGTVGGAAVEGSTGGGAHESAGLHFGARLGERYIDPMLLFRPVDLTKIVHLAPVGGTQGRGDRSWAVEASGLERGLDTVLSGSGASGSGTSGSGTSGVPDWVTTAGRGNGLAEQVGRGLGSWFGVAARGVPGGTFALDTARRLGAAAQAQLECDRDAPPADGTGGSGHHLLAVAGIDSTTDRATGTTFGLPVGELGYHADEVDWFSYAGAGRAYSAQDTYQSIVASARELGRHLRALEAEDPGREVDLIAHSQGGVVIDVFLQELYDPSDSRYPPIGTVITLASPHQGAPAAEAARRIAQSESGRAALGLGESVAPSADAPAVADLDPRSELMDELWDDALPDQVDLTSIAAVDDPVVPATQTEVPGAENVIVDPPGAMDHTPIAGDPRAMAAVRSALEGRAPPCLSPADATRGAIAPVVVTRLEQAVGRAGETAGEIVDRGADAVAGALDAVGLDTLIPGWRP